MCRWPLRGPTPIVDPILVTFGQICNFCDPNLVTFYLCIYLINPLRRSSKNELNHFLINWMKNTLLFTYNTDILIRFLTVNMNNSLTQKIRKCATPLKMQPHSSREKATPSSGTSPLVSYKEVPPPRAAPKLLSLLNTSFCCKVVVKRRTQVFSFCIIGEMFRTNERLWIRLPFAYLFLVRHT